MTTKFNTAAGAPGEGVAASTANTGGASGDAFDHLYLTDGSVVFTEALGVWSYHHTTDIGGWAATQYAFADTVRAAGRFDVYLTAYPDEEAGFPAGSMNLATVYTEEGQCDIYVLNDGRVLLTDSESDTVALSTEVLPLSQWAAVEWDLVFDAVGTYELRIYTDAAGSVDETLSGPETWSRGADTMHSTAFGTAAAGEEVSYYLRNVGASDSEIPARPPDAFVIPPALVDVETPAPLVGVAVPVVNVDVVVFAPKLIDASVALVAPADDYLLPTVLPTFTITVASDTPALTAQIQYDTDEDFTAPTTLTVAVPAGLSVNRASVKASVALDDDTTYFWRARAVNDFDVADWTPPFTFATSTFDGDALAGGSWTVSTDTVPYPHVWFLYPARGRVGDLVTAVGTGLGPTVVTATVGGADAPVDSFTSVAADGDAYTADRIISADTGRASPDHQRVVFEIPADAVSPGGVVYLDGS